MRAIFVLSGLLLVGAAQAQSSQPVSQPSSAPASQSIAATQPSSAPALEISSPSNEPAIIQCGDCLSDESPLPAPMYRAAAGLSVGGLAGFVTASKMMGAFPQMEQPGMKVSIGLGVASLASMNASIGALGVARYRHTGKIRPLLLSALASSGMVLGQFALGMGVAWSQDSESLDEEVEDNDIADAAAGTLLAGSATAIPVASGLLIKATKEGIKSIAKNRKSKHLGASASR